MPSFIAAIDGPNRKANKQRSEFNSDIEKAEGIAKNRGQRRRADYLDFRRPRYVFTLRRLPQLAMLHQRLRPAFVRS